MTNKITQTYQIDKLTVKRDGYGDEAPRVGVEVAASRRVDMIPPGKVDEKKITFGIGFDVPLDEGRMFLVGDVIEVTVQVKG